MWTNSHRPVLVLGLGNPIMGDDGVGIIALEQFRDRFEVGDGVELMDGGTWGMNLLPYIESAGKLLLVDAIRAGLEPGADVFLDGPDLPKILGQKLSAHQVDIVDVLTLAQVRGTLPAMTVALGVEPEMIEMRRDMTPAVERGTHRLPGRMAGQLREWGIRVSPRTPAHA
ncbi:MAG: HyaD/HybD family hydrogenase maturation endopeptidase [Gemmatimonadales bacterium]